jgi:hypothetical protein
MISGGVKTKRSLESSRRTSARAECAASIFATPVRGRFPGRLEAPLGSPHSFAPARNAQTTKSNVAWSKIALPNRLFSLVFTPVPSNLHLAENTRLSNSYNQFIFRHLRIAASYISRKSCSLIVLQIGYRGVRHSAPKRALRLQKRGGPGVRAASSSVFSLEHAQPVGVGLGVSVTYTVKPTRTKKVART